MTDDEDSTSWSDRDYRPDVDEMTEEEREEWREEAAGPVGDWMANPGTRTSHADESVDEILDEHDLIDALVITKGLVENHPESRVVREISEQEVRELFADEGLDDELIRILRQTPESQVREELGPLDDNH